MLLYILHHIEYKALNPKDDALGKKALDLRARWGNPADIQASMGNMGPSVLEVLIILALAMDDILYDPEIGERPEVYLWVLLENLGIYSTDFNDSEWTPDKRLYLAEVTNKWMTRDIGMSGHGSPFIFSEQNQEKIEDLRTTPWWTAMQWYCNLEL